MWTVGLISKECCKTYHYNDFTEAEKEYKIWLNCFKLNNDIKFRTTVINRDCNDKIKSIKNITNDCAKNSINYAYYLLYSNKCFIIFTA